MSGVSQFKATLVGQLGLLMWAVVSALFVLIKHLPTIEVLFYIFTSSAVLSIVWMGCTGSWRSIEKQSVWLWLFNIAGISGSDILFLYASQNAPQQEVVLINYLWPTFIVLLAPLLPSEKFQWKYLVSALISFVGIAVLVTDGQGMDSFEWQYAKGYAVTVCCALLWSIYAVASKRFPRQAPEAIGLYCATGSVFLAVFFPSHIMEITPTWTELLILVYMGCTSHNIAYICWGFGMRHGNVRSLALQVYLSPFVSLGTLVLIGHASPSSTLWLAAVCVCGAGLISTVNWRRLIRSPSNS